MTWLERVETVLGEGLAGTAVLDDATTPLAADVPLERWQAAATLARDQLGCRFFDWLSAVDEQAAGFTVVAHLAAIGPGGVEHLLLRTALPPDQPEVASIAGVYAGASWHERETHEMFGIGFSGAPSLTPLLLPDGFEGHPLRKDFVLASRVAKPWPGAKEPGESEHDSAPSRRRTRPPGVPDPSAWGPRPPGVAEGAGG